jgi:gamma-glutamyltranspeptidase/glutathione hydrolase
LPRLARTGWAAYAGLDRGPIGRVKIEEPVMTAYRGIDVYKLTHWTQGPAMLQALNLLEGLDLKSMGYNSARYIHTLYQVMNLAFADRDFYYERSGLPPWNLFAGFSRKEYARARLKLIDWRKKQP